MYENITYELILQRMLDRVPITVDKREGSIIYDALAPAAAELQQMYIELDAVLNETFADTASREYLIKRAAERGIVPTAASKAILKGVFNINVPIGSRYSLEDLTYIVTEKIADYQFKLQCEIAGAEGNLHFGSLIPIDYIAGLTSAQLTEVLIQGEDEEATEALRSRYYESLDSQAYGGNVADYKVKVNSLQGVGGVKVYPAWNGGGTVKLVIIDSDFSTPSLELLNSVKNAIDPVANSGQGVGLAPIGHAVTVMAVTETYVDIDMTITYQSGWDWTAVQASVEAMIDSYFRSLIQTWESTKTTEANSGLVVRISQIESRMLALAGIVDVSGTILNGVQSNLVLDVDDIPVRGALNG